MTDYEYLINTDFEYLKEHGLTSGTKIREFDKNLVRDKTRLIRFRKGISVWDSTILYLTTMIEGKKVTIPSPSPDYLRNEVPIFSFRSRYFEGEINYTITPRGDFKNFKEIINFLTKKLRDKRIDLFIVSDYFEDDNFLEIYKEETVDFPHRKLISPIDISDHFSDLVDVFSKSPVKPDNYRELLRIYLNLGRCGISLFGNKLMLVPKETIILWMSGITTV